MHRKIEVGFELGLKNETPDQPVHSARECGCAGYATLPQFNITPGTRSKDHRGLPRVQKVLIGHLPVSAGHVCRSPLASRGAVLQWCRSPAATAGTLTCNRNVLTAADHAHWRQGDAPRNLVRLAAPRLIERHGASISRSGRGLRGGLG